MDPDPNDSLTCPLVVADVTEDDEGKITEWRAEPCGATLFLEFAGSYQLSVWDLSHEQPITSDWAHTTTWKLVCSNGHAIVSDPALTLHANDLSTSCEVSRLLRSLPYTWGHRSWKS